MMPTAPSSLNALASNTARRPGATTPWTRGRRGGRWNPHAAGVRPRQFRPHHPFVQVTRQQLEAEIVALNAQLASRYLLDKDLVIKRDRLVEQLQALK